MIKNKEIEIRIENEAEIEATLAKVNGRAKTHTFTTFGEILRLSKEAEDELDDLGLVKSLRKGAKYWAESAEPVAKRYKSSRIGTNVTLVRKKDCWALSHAETYHFYPTQGGKRKIYVTKMQADYMVEKFAKRYSVMS